MPTDVEQRHAFAHFNRERAFETARALPDDAVLLVLGLDCEVARTIAKVCHGGELPDYAALAPDQNPTLWVVVPANALLQVYALAADGSEQTQRALRTRRPGHRLVCFVAFGGTIVAQVAAVRRDPM